MSLSASGSPASQKLPPSRTRISKESTSTPFSKGSSTNPGPHRFAKQSDFASYLCHDVQLEKRVSPVDFCRLILNLEFKSSNGVDEFKAIRNACSRKVESEDVQDEPFCDYMNAILAHGKSGYKACLSDGAVWWGTSATIDAFVRGCPEGETSHVLEFVSFFAFMLNEDDMLLWKSQSTGLLQSLSKSLNSKSMSTQASFASRSQDGGGGKQKGHPSSSTTERQAKRLAASDKPQFVPVFRKWPSPPPSPVQEGPSDADFYPVTQCAGYALDMMSCGLREHVISFLIEDDTIQMLYYDRSILIRSEPFSFIRDWPMFESLIAHLGQMSAEDWGFRPTLMKVNEEYMALESLRKPESSTGDTLVDNFFEGAVLELRDDWKLELKRIVRQTRGLCGRGTIAIAAERDRGSELPREKVFVKISWQPKSRRSESKFLQHIYNKIAEKKGEYKWVSEHLPALKFEASFGDLVGIQSRLKAYHEFKDVYEERTLRIHVFDVLHKLSAFRSRPVFFIRRFAQIVRCHQWLHDVAGVLHRDVSLNILMYRKNLHGTIYGVLNDFDLASLVADLDKSPQSSQRTGTWIYMAFDLLSSPNPPRHLNRHDLESFFYILLDVIHNPHGQSLNMGTWFALDDLSLGSIKRAACSIASLRDAALPSCAAFVPFLSQIQDLWNQYVMTLRARDHGVELDDVVAGTAITGASFLSPLDAFLLGRSDD